VHPVRKPTWQQATALVSLSTCGAMTGFAFAHGTVDEMTSPTRMPVHLLALKKPAKPVSAPDSALRSAIVNVANYYLRMAQTKSPAEMEALIWGTDSVDGVDHGESCAAFASLTLALGAQATGQESWVTGGTTYPWPLHPWADVRVDPNPASPGIISVLQDAQAQHRWHPLGDGYQPQPGDWVMFDGHVEVVTRYSAGVLYTIGGDSGPNLSVNAHTFTGPLDAQGVAGFVNNGELLSAVSPATSTTAGGTTAGGTAAAAAETAGIQAPGQPAAVTASVGEAAVPGTRTAALTASTSQMASAGQAAGLPTATTQGSPHGRGTASRKGTARMVGTAGGLGYAGMQSMVTVPGMVAVPGMMAGAGMAAGDGATAGHGDPARAGSPARVGAAGRAGSTARAGSAGRAGSTGRAGTASRAGTGPRAGQGQRTGTAAIPGLQATSDGASRASSAPATPSYTRNNPPAAAAHVPDTSSQQAFISQIAPGAIAAQSRYGIPAAVTIAQAIDESGWGQSALAIRDNNLFGIKGNGPAGSDVLPTQEFQNGQWVTTNAAFRVYHNVAQSIADHTALLATGPSYQQAMADRHLPDAFATDLTGVYATDPQYGSNLIAIMRLYNLYRYDATAPAPSPTAVQGGAANLGETANMGGTANLGGSVSQAGAVSQGGTVGQGAAGSHDGTGSQGAATIPGVLDAYMSGPGQRVPVAQPPVAQPPVNRARPPGQRPGPRVAPRRSQAGARASRYVPQIPQTVTTAFITSAKAPLSRAEPLYDDVASHSGIRWELLAACDWMQCQAQPRYSPVHGEKLGTVNSDRTVYRTKSEALAQCAGDLIELAMAVYWIDITARRPLSVRDLAKVFAAFRWGGLLKLHDISAMEFPYSVAGLTAQHTKMRWPDIKDANAPDKPGTRFRIPFGAVPVVLCLGYPAVA
jgi:flagellum-specific peptidoglycan hydrolase FlgJ